MCAEVAGSNIADSKTEHFMKNALQDIYKFQKSGGQNERKIDELRREASELKQHQDSDVDDDDDSSDYDSDDSVDAVRRDYDIKSILEQSDSEQDADNDDDDDDDGFQEKQQYTFDDFLDKVRQRFDKEDRGEVEFDLDENADDDEEFDYDRAPNEEEIVRLSGLTEEEKEQLMQRDMWERNLANAPTINEGEETHRLAIMNFDYTMVTVRTKSKKKRMKRQQNDPSHTSLLTCDAQATDFFMIFSSMCPPNGSIKSVTIYLSDFGKKRLEEEKKYGPRSIFNTEEEINELRKVKRRIKEHHAANKSSRLFTKSGRHKKTKVADDEKEIYEETLDNVEQESLNPIRVREYEMEKLRYYFGVVVCDRKETANKLYEDLDEHEIEFTSIKLDLRFINDDISFEKREIL